MNLPEEWRNLLVIPLKEVAERTPWSERSLKEDCKAGVIRHMYYKGSYGFTPQQLVDLMDRYSVEATAAPVTAKQQEADELATARAYNAGDTRGRAAA